MSFKYCTRSVYLITLQNILFSIGIVIGVFVLLTIEMDPPIAKLPQTYSPFLLPNFPTHVIKLTSLTSSC